MLTYKKQAQDGLLLIEESIIKMVENYPNGITNSEVAEKLGLESSGKDGKNKNYLSWSILGNLVKKNKLIKKETRYFLA